jgi:hypothetical protein
MKVKELTPTQSFQKVKELLKTKTKLTKKNFVPGSLLMYFYDAKDKKQTYDRTPLVLILKNGPRHTLGLNFHWLPIKMRLKLIQAIFRLNKDNIAKQKPLEFRYIILKPMLKKLGYAPCIRLYINSRISSNGAIVPPERLVEIASLKSETFTQGRYSAEQLYSMARRKKN